MTYPKDFLHQQEALMRIERVSFHEAGHAAVSLALGWPVDRVEITRDEWGNPCGSFAPAAPPRWYRAESASVSRRARSVLESDIIISLAGIISERIYLGPYLSHAGLEIGASRDLWDADRGVRCLVAENDPDPSRTAAHHRARLERRAHQLVSRNWLAISRLAVALRRARALAGDEVLSIFQEPGGRWEPAAAFREYVWRTEPAHAG
jgi:hypothetical protein